MYISQGEGLPFILTANFCSDKIRESVLICLNGIEIRQRILHDLSRCVKVNRYNHYNICIAIIKRYIY